ncbi:hypothetical protein [Methylomagnum ishizawai]|uniref:hypothetical protein n=1 Tax=Methylomagnum ishizawai TaxID=1760988 RepID=UPI001C32B23F|nr:hypothetical protein [Methylomagnum ishizawai]BBL74036.1 hypothetical protein MishRS11D_11340 [Methylomagnum ishizawai]
MKPATRFPLLLIGLSSALLQTQAVAGPPALMTATVHKQASSTTDCQLKATEILEKLHLEIEDHGNGTVFGYGERSTVSVNCQAIGDDVYIPIAVASQKEEAADLIMGYVRDYMKGKSKPLAEAPIDASKPRRSAD